MTSYPAQLTEDEAKKGNAKPEKLKKMYVLAALLIESYHESMKQQSKSKHKGKRGADVSCVVHGSRWYGYSQYVILDACRLCLRWPVCWKKMPPPSQTRK